MKLERVGGGHSCYSELVTLHQARYVLYVAAKPVQLGYHYWATVCERFGPCWTL
ncbi:hypothetical protein D3C81_2228230 [compost metagenome]